MNNDKMYKTLVNHFKGKIREYEKSFISYEYYKQIRDSEDTPQWFKAEITRLYRHTKLQRVRAFLKRRAKRKLWKAQGW